MTSITVLVGNPQPGSRTRLVGEEVAAQIADRLAAESGSGRSAVDTIEPAIATIELAEVADRLFTFPEGTVEALLEQVAASTLLVVASPTYKASYTGLLKAFVDRYGTDGLQGVTAVPLLTVGGPQHALAVEHTLRPLLVELGASVPTRGIAFPSAQTEQRAEVVRGWLEAQWEYLAPTLGRH